MQSCISSSRIVALIFLLASCSQKETLFTRLTPSQTGIDFRNLLQEDNPAFNIVLYPYFYNGGGVAIGDINNDGLPDIIFTGNMVKNRLYLNKGNMQFEDITQQSGIAEKEGWCTGVTMADVNGDGLPDIYICRSGLSNVNYRRNLLYINNGDLTFSEKAAEYGLDDPGYSTQASFFDYDKDGDLDLILINQSEPKYSIGNIEYLQTRSQKADPAFGNKLFRNDGGHFTDVTAASGITSNPLSFSLGISTADINKDGWPDIYISNDFKEPDYLYINNHDGTFTDSLKYKIKTTSLYGMGIDVNDYNNDQLPDILQMDMLPEGNHAQKMHMGGDNFDQYNHLFTNGMFPQFMKNTLQKNNGNGSFSEVAQLAGISNTDWSWSPLFADFDNDGFKDIFISNGYKRDNTDLEFIKYSYAQSQRMHEGAPAVSAAEYISHMPGIYLSNYIFRNNGHEQFENKVIDWGLTEKGFSHGAVYADLDNDGDLDLVINNTGDYAGIYRNNASEKKRNHFLRVQLKGDRNNMNGIGAKINVYDKGTTQYQEQLPVRGFQSTVDPVIHFGLGASTLIDSLVVTWPNGLQQVLKNVKADQTIVVSLKDALPFLLHQPGVNSFLQNTVSPVPFKHVENEFNDFTVQSLLPHYFSRRGPCMAHADVNGDGLEDIFIGGAKGQAGSLWIQTAKGFVQKQVTDFITDAASEDINALFFDADGDGDMDLYVCSGGYEYPANDPLLQGRLYMNDGKGNFKKNPTALPQMRTSSAVITAADFDKDGFMDLFIGGYVIPGQFPLSPRSYLLHNNGKGIFEDVTAKVCRELVNPGMLTAALWLDVNKDGYPDLITAGEWEPIKVYINHKGILTDATKKWMPFDSNGWWNCLQLADLDGDGDMDIIAGNQGWNNQFHASGNEPMDLWAKDFDHDGFIDPILFYGIQNTSYPAMSRDDITGQMPSLNKKYIHYQNYADVTMNTFFKPDELKGALHLQTKLLSTVWLENKGEQGFVLHELPVQAQEAPVFAIQVCDLTKDGKPDLLLAGNNSYTRIKFGRFNGSNGTALLNDGKGNFRSIPASVSGFSVTGDIRSMGMIKDKLFVGVNNEGIQFFQLK